MADMMRAYKFLKDDFRSGSGDEGPWSVGETRVHDGPLVLCESGYHSSRSWYDALAYAPGNVAAIVEISADGIGDDTKQVSRTCCVLGIRNVALELRLLACDYAERALDHEEAAGRLVDERSRAAIAVARRFAHGEATDDELAAARAAARASAGAAARAAAGAAARAATEAAALGTARAATGAVAWEAARGAAGAAARAATRAAAGAAALGTTREAARAAAWEAAREAAGAAAWEAAWAATAAAAAGTTREAARAATGEAAQETEIVWQRHHFAEVLDPLFADLRQAEADHDRLEALP